MLFWWFPDAPSLSEKECLESPKVMMEVWRDIDDDDDESRKCMLVNDAAANVVEIKARKSIERQRNRVQSKIDQLYERDESLRVNLPMAPSMLRLALPALLPLEMEEASELGTRWALGLDSLTKLAAPPRPMW